MAEGVRVHETRPGRGRHRPMETGDRRPVARAYGGASGDRGGRGGPRAQPHAGTGAPEVRPRRLTPDGVGVSAAPPLIRAPRCFIADAETAAPGALGDFRKIRRGPRRVVDR